MGFLDSVRGALKDAISAQSSRRDATVTKDDAAADTSADSVIPAPTEAKLETYTVRTGDTLAEIGARYGVSSEEIARLNSIENPDLIFPGQVFRIPKS
jgi:LysM repeat protein